MKLLQLSIASYNTRDGIGLFQGVNRYAVLTDRARLSAVKTTTLTRFWSELLTSMRWPTPTKRVDALLLPLLQSDTPTSVLAAIADNTPALMSIARALNDEDRVAKRLTIDEHELDDTPTRTANPQQGSLL